MASEGDWSIGIKGASATTGAKPLVSHPGFQRANDKAPWKPNFGAIQHAKFKAASVGLVKEVKVTTANDHSWSLKWIKVNTNDAKTGLGSGVYYAGVQRTLDKANGLDSKLLATGASVGTVCKDQHPSLGDNVCLHRVCGNARRSLV